MPQPPHDGSWTSVNWTEVLGTVAGSAMIGLVRCLYLIRRGRQFRWIDVILEPSLAVIAGVLIWAVLEVSNTPEVLKTVFVSLGAWGGPRTIHWLELKYMGGSRANDTTPGELGGPEDQGGHHG